MSEVVVSKEDLNQVNELAKVAKLAQLESDKANLSHQNAVLALYLKYGLKLTDSISEDGKVVSKEPEVTETKDTELKDVT